MLVQKLADTGQDEAELVRRGLVAQVQGVPEEEPVAHGEVLDADRRELAVGNGDDGAGKRADLRGAKADVLDGALVLAGLAEIAQADGFVPDEEEPAEEVLDRLLGGKGHGDAADAEAGHNGREVDARKVIEDDHEPHDDGKGLHERRRKADDRIGGLGPAALDDLRTGIDQIEEKPCQADDGYRRGQKRPEQPGEKRGRAEGKDVNRARRKKKHQRAFRSH